MTEILAGIIGALLGAGTAYLRAQRAYKTTLVFDLHRELNTVEMGRHRYRAEKLLQSNPDLRFEQLNDQYAEQVDSLLAIFRFFQRLGLAIKYHQVHEKIACEMFASIFYHWYYPVFELKFKGAQVNGRKQVVYLAQWFCQAVAVEEHEKLKIRAKEYWATKGIA